MFSPDLEAASGISRAQGQKKSKQLAAVEKFQDADPADIPEQLKNAVLAIYTTKIGAIDKD